ncbi:hypothetical protein MP638_003671, partial [Amoeboaphelidium occidentale]
MEYLENRKSSFENWPHDKEKFAATPSTLSAAGFYYNPVLLCTINEDDYEQKDSVKEAPMETTSDRVTCYLCKVSISNWAPEDDPVKRHADEYFECPLVKILSFYGNTRELIRARQNTFGLWWPHSNGAGNFKADPSSLALAGFSFWPTLNHRDNVRCIDCNQNVFGWSGHNDPVEVHRNNSPSCKFVRTYLMDVNEKKENVKLDSQFGPRRMKRYRDEKENRNGDPEEVEEKDPHALYQEERKRDEEMKQKYLKYMLMFTNEIRELGKTMEKQVKKPVIQPTSPAELEEKERQIVEMRQEIDILRASALSLMESQKEQQQLVYARSTEDQEEIARLNVKLAEMYEESISFKQAWQMLKSENALLIANNTVKNKYISQLDANSRRTWFEGEIQLFSVRAGLQKVDGAFNLDQTSTPFLGLGDIPWPCSPNVSLDQDVSIDMIRSFLLQDFNSEDAVFFCT